jgi:hypothetical protein
MMITKKKKGKRKRELRLLPSAPSLDGPAKKVDRIFIVGE